MIAFKSASELVAMLRGRHISPAELLDEYQSRVQRFNTSLNAIIWHAPDATDQARRADVASPLAGLPMTVKEAYNLTGSPTTWGIPELAGSIAKADAVAIERLKRAGAVIFGKTNVPLNLADHQSYNDIYGTTNNPWDLARTPGGSSGGSAAALAAGLTALEMGSDIGGSIRQPAHCCGVFGHKPTYSLVPSRGHSPVPESLSEPDIAVVGPLARSAVDLELALDVVAGPDRLDPGIRYELPRLDGRKLGDLRVAVWANDAVAPVSRDCEAAVHKVAAAFRGAGAVVNDTARPDFSSADAWHVYLTLMMSFAGGVLPPPSYAELVAQAKRLSDDDQGELAQMLRAQTISHHGWLQMNFARDAMRWAWRRFFDEYDLVLAPVATTVAFPHDHSPQQARTLDIDGVPRSYLEILFWAGLFGVAHLPSTVIPTGPNAAGLPVGVQIVGPAWGDRVTIGAARLLEAEGFAFQPPPAYA
jgi:amidase